MKSTPPASRCSPSPSSRWCRCSVPRPRCSRRRSGRSRSRTSIAWKAIGATVLSTDGQWFGYRLAPQEGDARDRPQARSAADKELRFPAGEQPQGEGGGGGRGGARRRGVDARVLRGRRSGRRSRPIRRGRRRSGCRRQRRPIQSSVTLVNLATGEKKEYPKIRRFAFSGESSGVDRAASLRPRRPGGGGGGGGGRASGRRARRGRRGAGGARASARHAT